MTLRRLAYRIGRRGAFLGFLGLIGLVIGYSLIAPIEPLPPSYVGISRLLPIPVWGVLWCVVGIVSLVQTFTLGDRLAYTLNALAYSGWAGGFVLSQLAGVPRSFLGAVVYAGFATVILLCSGWPESPSILEGRRVRD